MGLSDRLKSVFLSSKETPKAKAIKSEKTSDGIDRVDPDKLERLYMQDGIAFSSVNTISQTFLSADYQISSNSDVVKQEIETFLDDADFQKMLGRIIQDLCIYGNTYLEIVRNKAGDKIVDLEPMDAKRMTYPKGSDGNVLYENGHVKGYLQKLPRNYNTENIPDSRLETVDNGRKAIKFDYEDVLHLKLYRLGDNPRGVGILEPLYNEFTVKQNIEQGLGEAVYRKGYPRLVVELGDEEHPPQQDDIDDMRDKLKNINAKDEFVVPYYYNMKYLESSKPEKMHSALEYSVDLIISGIGIPKAFITGIGNDVNRSALDKQTLMFERYIKMLQNKVTKELREKVFRTFANERNLPEVPTIDFDEISTDDLNDKAERLKKYSKAGVLDIDENMKSKIAEQENLD